MVAGVGSTQTYMHRDVFVCKSGPGSLIKILWLTSDGQVYSRVCRFVGRPPGVNAEPGYRTWRGERGEEWSSAQGLESILLSIQSLMSSNPYENEPGFEDANEAQDKKNQKEYVQKVLVTSAIFTYEQPLTLTLDPP